MRNKNIYMKNIKIKMIIIINIFNIKIKWTNPKDIKDFKIIPRIIT